MKINKLLIYSFFLIATFSYSQTRKKADFGNPTLNDFNLKTYEKDPDAAGVVLFESGEYSIELVNYNITLLKKVYKKIKVLNAKEFKQGTVEISYYRNKNRKEVIKKITALTHNGPIKSYIPKDKIYDIEESEKWSKKRFTFPNIKDGSILEYEYTLSSPFFFSLNGWDFQEELPKIYSEFRSEIPGNYIYNRSLKGYQKLYINESDLKRNCFSLPGYKNSGDCEVSLYAMIDIPAAKKESHMLSIDNYKSSVKYELMRFNGFDGMKQDFSKTWKDVDREFKNDKNIGRELGYRKFYEKNIPSTILSKSDNLEKAKEIYYFIQNHYTWNGNYGLFGNVNIKNAFEKKSGSISEINISLINALRAAGLDAKLVIHSTRNNGMPTKLYPVLTNFNYVLVHLTISGEEYLLDASNKYLPFAILPFRTLSSDVRVLDFKKGSYWSPIQPFKKSISYIQASINIDDLGSINGTVNEVRNGYNAVSRRSFISNKTIDDIISEKEKSIKDLEISDYSFENLQDLEQPIKEQYSILYETETIGTKIHINPFFLNDGISENPFKEEKRQFPINFGYPSSNTYLLNLDLKGQYEVEFLPKNRSVKLPDGAGSCTVYYTESNGSINIRFNYKLNTYDYSTDSYEYLKEFFAKVVEFQTKETIVLKKI